MLDQVAALTKSNTAKMLAKLMCVLMLSFSRADITTRNIVGGYTVNGAQSQNEIRARHLNDQAVQLEATQQYQTAREMYKEAMQLDPNNWMVPANYARCLLEIRKMSDDEKIKEELYANALRLSDQALALNPSSAGLYANHGITLKDNDHAEEAAPYLQKAISLNPTLIEAHYALADLYHSVFADAARGEAQYLQVYAALSASTDPNLRALRHEVKFRILNTIIPHVYDGGEMQMRTARARYQHYLLTSFEGIDCTNIERTVGSGAFGYYLVYQGQNDLVERVTQARLYRACAKSRLNRIALPTKRLVIPSKRLKVGFVSTKLYKHSVGKLISGVICKLAKEFSFQFHVTVYFLGDTFDELSSTIAQNVHEYHRLPKTSLEETQNIILNDQLDILVYPDIGMEEMTYFLSFNRLAPVTAVFWGHPVTTGVEHTVDYFITSKHFHIHDIEYEKSKFVEELYFMDGVTTHFFAPVSHSHVSRAAFGIRPGFNVYACLQTSYKLTPLFDKALLGILKRDLDAVIVLMLSPNQFYGEKLRARLERTILNEEGDAAQSLLKRFVWVNTMNHSEFLGLAAIADVILDPFPFGGGVTTLEMLSVGAPIIALPNKTSVLQLTRGFYYEMDRAFFQSCCLAETVDEYIEKAYRVASVKTYGTSVKARIHEKKSVLFESKSTIAEWAFFLAAKSKNGIQRPQEQLDL